MKAGSTLPAPVRLRDGPAKRTRILDTAVRLFAEQGVDGTSLREIMSVAGVSISQINYHFGTKEELLRAIFERRILAWNSERLSLLDALFAAPRKPDVEQILWAYLLPVYQFDPDGRPDDFIRLLGRIGSDGSQMARSIIAEYLDPVHRRFLDAFRLVLPNVPDVDLFWRLHVLLCVMVQTVVNPDRIIHLSGGLCDPRDRDDTLRHLVPALAAAMRASVEGKSSQGLAPESSKSDARSSRAGSPTQTTRKAGRKKPVVSILKGNKR